MEIKTVNRYDEYTIDTKFEETPEGYLQGTAIITNIGVFPYMTADGLVREARKPEDVFHPDTLASIIGKPVTNDHPAVQVTVDNIHEYQVGFTGSSPINDQLYLAVPLTITDKSTIEDIKSGKKRALSCGYSADLIKEDGNYLGTPYEYRQTNIKMNHVAVVEAGRAGDAARIRMDGALAPIKDTNPTQEEIMADNQNMKSVKLDGVEYNAEAKVIEALHNANNRADTAEKQLADSASELTKVTAQYDEAKARVDSLKEELETLKANHVDADKVAEMVRERVALESVASKMGIEVKADATDLDIMKEVILKNNPKATLKDDSIYIKARFDAVMESVAEEKADEADVREVNAPKADAELKEDSSSKTARQNYIEFIRSASK